MRKGRHFLTHVLEESAMDTVSIQPIIEIVGDRRVLIENHQGVAAYGKEKILVCVKFGSVCICGCNLEMMHMTKEQLVVYGRIDSVSLQRRR